MNRRDSLKTLAIGSISASTPLAAFNKGIENNIEGNKVEDKTERSGRTASVPGIAAGNYMTLHLVADSTFFHMLPVRLPAYINAIPRNALDSGALMERLGAGDGMIWVGNPRGIPKELSVGAFLPSTAAVSVSVTPGSPLPLDNATFGDTSAFSAYIAPPKEMPNHNIDEEVRADFLPILEGRDRFGQVIAYPGLLMSYYAPSLSGRRFQGSECFFFLFDEPFEALSVQGWTALFRLISKRRGSGLQVSAYNTDYASYKPGERVQVRTRIQNRRPRAVSALLRYSVKAPGAADFTPLAEMRRVAEGGSDTEALCDFRPDDETGLWTVRLEVLQDVDRAELLAVIGKPLVIDRRDLGFLVLELPVKTSVILTLNGPGIVLDGREGFWAGTHYYPSTSWWEWVWRDFRPLKAAEDFAAIRRSGYRIVRVWVDPVLDEPVLRAMDAAIQLAADNGIVLDICIFTQWSKKIGFERSSGEQVLFDFRDPRDFNIISFSLRNLGLQREYAAVLARRWKRAGNILFNLANEAYVKDPDVSQMDEEVVSWHDIPAIPGTVRDTLLFRRWAREISKAIRDAGGSQLIMPGYMFSTLDGGDVYLANTDAPILPWHSYLPPERTASTVQYFDPISSKRPLIVEEFGFGQWNPVERYDANVHYALGAGAACAMSYEWGISWLARESCYWPLPLREAMAEHPDPRWFPPYLELGKNWSERSVGLCPTPSGTGYGSIYHGTPFPAEAADALGRLSLMGQNLQRGVRPETVYVVVPEAQLDALVPIEKTLKALWFTKALFGVWQEAMLETIPSAAKAIICPCPLSQASKPVLQTLRSRGIQVFNGPDEWRSCKVLEKADVANGEKVDLLARRTSAGTLFTMISKEPVGQVLLKYEHSSATVDLDDFGLVHITGKGVILLEGTGNLRVDNSPFCKVEQGRLIVASEDGMDLIGSRQLKLMVTAPTKIIFERKVVSLSLSDGFNQLPQAVNTNFLPGTVLTVDDQLARYVIHCTFH